MVIRLLQTLVAICAGLLMLVPGSAAALTIEASNATDDYWQRPAIYHSEDDGAGLANVAPLQYYAVGVVVSESGLYTLDVTVDYAATLFIYEGAFAASAPLQNLQAGYDLYPLNTNLSFIGELSTGLPYVFVFSAFDADGTFGPATGNFTIGFDGPGEVSLVSIPAPAAGVLLLSALIAGAVRRAVGSSSQ